MPSLTDLPVDLHPLIFEHLSRREYYALALVCKLLHQEAISSLYHDIAFRAGKSSKCARKLAFLLRTMLEKPQFATNVSTFRLLGPHLNWTKDDPWLEEETSLTANFWGLEGCNTLSRAQKIFASNQFYQLVDAEMHKSMAQYHGRSKDALAILVVTRFTQLKVLELGDGFLIYSLFLPQIIKRAGQLFPKLDRVVLGDRMPDVESSISYIDLDLIRPIFYLPSIKTCQWRMSQPWQFQWNAPERPRSDSLTTLHLFRTSIHRNTLAEILLATPNLKRFKYEQEILFNRLMLWSNMDYFTNLQGLSSALRNVKNTLEELRLSIKLAPGSLSSKELLSGDVQLPPIHDTLIIHEMAMLRKIELPMIMVLGWVSDFAARLEEVLPTSIEELTLRDDFIKFCPWATDFNCFKKISRLGEYLDGRAVHAPSLRYFKIRLSKPRANLWLDDAIADISTPIFGEGVRHGTSQDDTREVHYWNFGGVRVDSGYDTLLPDIYSPIG